MSRMVCIIRQDELMNLTFHSYIPNHYKRRKQANKNSNLTIKFIVCGRIERVYFTCLNIQLYIIRFTHITSKKNSNFHRFYEYKDCLVIEQVIISLHHRSEKIVIFG
jgi:hypothetical protein